MTSLPWLLCCLSAILEAASVQAPGTPKKNLQADGKLVRRAFHNLLAKIGQRFSRPDFARSRHAGGAGLGLAIVKNSLRLHGGTLSFDSAPGHCTTAMLQFPTC